MAITISGISLTVDPLREVSAPAGGIEYGGTVPTVSGTLVQIVAAPAGGVEYDGATPEISGQVRIIRPLASGIEYTSGATVKRGVIAPTGGTEYGGTVPSMGFVIVAPTGGVEYGGTVPDIVGQVRILRVPEGGSVYGGSLGLSTADAPTILTGRRITAPTGGIEYGGGLPFMAFLVEVPAGGVVHGGTVPTIHTPYFKELSDSVRIFDLADTSWLRSVNESLAVADTVSLKLSVKISEYLSAKETILDTISCTHELTDTVSLVDVAGFKFLATINESLTLTDTVSLKLALLLVDYLVFRGAVATQASFNHELSESVAATDAAVFSRIERIAEELSATDTLSLILTLKLADSVNLADVLLNTCSFNKDLTEYIQAVDTVRQINTLAVTDTAAIADALSDLLVAELSLSESVAVVDSVTDTSYAVLTVNESLVFYETVTSTGHFYHTLSEGLHLNVSVVIDGEIYECYVLNTPKFLPSVYSGFNFNSYCTYQGRSYGANSEGIFELTGTTDAGAEINTGAAFHKTDFGARNKKRFRKAYIGVDGTTPVMVMESDTGERKAYTIDDKGKVSASRNIQGREWTLSLTDFDSLESMSLVPVILSRGK